MPQRRLVRLSSKYPAVWIDLSYADEARAVEQIGNRKWIDIVRARMAGEPIEKLANMQSRLSSEQFREGLWIAFGIMERYLWDLAEWRARQIVTGRMMARGPGGAVILNQ